MPVIYELRGRSGCICRVRTQPIFRMRRRLSVLSRYFSAAHHVGEWTNGARPRSNILSRLKHDAEKMEGDPREILVCPAGDPYQSDEAARLMRKALLILEQYRLRVHVMTSCGMRSARGFRYPRAIAGNTAR